MKFKVRIPLQYVKPVCIAAVLVGIFAVAAGSWITGLCLLLGAYLLEKSCYRCPHCGKNLDIHIVADIRRFQAVKLRRIKRPIWPWMTGSMSSRICSRRSF